MILPSILSFVYTRVLLLLKTLNEFFKNFLSNDYLKMAKSRSRRSRSRSPSRRTKAECALVKSRSWRKGTRGVRKGSCAKKSRRSRSRKSHSRKSHSRKSHSRKSKSRSRKSRTRKTKSKSRSRKSKSRSRKTKSRKSKGKSRSRKSKSRKSRGGRIRKNPNNPCSLRPMKTCAMDPSCHYRKRKGCARRSGVKQGLAYEGPMGPM